MNNQSLPPSAVDACETPAFILDESRLLTNLRALRQFADDAGCAALYSIKALTLPDVLSAAAARLDGFSVSSLFEARIARQICEEIPHLSFVSAVLRDEDAAEIAGLCDRVTLNSLSQLHRCADSLAPRCEIGLRVNPGTCWVDDARSNPCRRDTHLGLPLEELADILRTNPNWLSAVRGLHLHANRHSDCGQQLAATIDRIEGALGEHLDRFQWLNLGGGYDFSRLHDEEVAVASLQAIKSRFPIEVIIEPGASVTQSAGFFVTSVADIHQRQNLSVAVLDFSVNHWPELFEYQIRPRIAESAASGAYPYRIAGCSCLAGDVLGEYTFQKPLRIGDRLVLPDAGAYSIGKAHPFNGINLPSIYLLRENGELERRKQFTYEEFAARCGFNQNVPI